MATVAVAVLVAVLLSSLAILKGKPLTGLIGMFIPPISLVGVARLAAPDSWWARRRYDPGGRNMARAKVRWERIKARRRPLADALAGAPGIQADSASGIGIRPYATTTRLRGNRPRPSE